MELINIIKNGIPMLIDKLGELLPFEFMIEEEKRICQNNTKVRHLIMCMSLSTLMRCVIHLLSYIKVQKR